MFLLARTRLFLARHRVVRWAVVLGIAGLAAGSTASALARVREAERAWGESRTVWVATADLTPGEPVAAAQREVPVAVVPDAAVIEPPEGTLARQRIGRGEIVTTADVARADWVPPGMVAIAVPVESSNSLTVSQPVTVYATGEALGSGTVVAVGEGWVEIAVDADDAGEVSAAASARLAVVGRNGGPLNGQE